MSKITEIYDGYKNFWLQETQEGVVIPDWVKERREICGSCEHLRSNVVIKKIENLITGKKESEGFHCGLCGCSIKAKTASAESNCPDNRWPMLTKMIKNNIVLEEPIDINNQMKERLTEVTNTLNIIIAYHHLLEKFNDTSYIDIKSNMSREQQIKFYSQQLVFQTKELEKKVADYQTATSNLIEG